MVPGRRVYWISLMSIFELHSQVLADYCDFVRAFFTVANQRAREFVQHALIEEARLWPDFLLQVRNSCQRRLDR